METMRIATLAALLPVALLAFNDKPEVPGMREVECQYAQAVSHTLDLDREAKLQARVAIARICEQDPSW